MDKINLDPEIIYPDDITNMQEVVEPVEDIKEDDDRETD